MSIILTRRAAEQAKLSAAATKSENMPLRVAAQKKPDGTIDYKVGFDEAGMTDIRMNYYGVEVIVAPISDHLLDGATMDYVELEHGDFQFIFLNPNDKMYVPPDPDSDA